MKVLVVNCGSSSIKYQLFEMPQRQLLAKGYIERIGSEASLVYQIGDKNEQRSVEASDHQQAMQEILALLMSPSTGVLSDDDAIEAVGHRVVHGGEEFTGSVLIDDAVLASIERMARLAPLHNPPNLTGIRAAMQALPGVPQVACFDTAFHATIPAVAFTYALPFELYEDLGIRRYGFHGTSHRYVAQRGADLLGIPLDKFNGITCHLGNGSSITAVRNGKSVDTSMGLTPLEGVAMGTRCGDIDPAILLFLAEEGHEIASLNELCNKRSGVLGISGCSNDMRTLISKAEQGHARSQLAIDVFCYRIKKYIGAYWAVLGRVDAVVFTGGIGENAPLIRDKVCSGMERLGLELAPQLNQQSGDSERRIDSTSDTAILVVPTDEEGTIADDSYQLLLEHSK